MKQLNLFHPIFLCMGGNLMNDYELSTSFYIDDDGYTDRDRLMFVCGVEFEMIYRLLQRGCKNMIDRPVHQENVPRIVKLCQSLNIKYTIEQVDGHWSNVTVKAQHRAN